MRKIEIISKKASKYLGAEMPAGTIFYIVTEHKKKHVFMSDKGMIFSNDILTDIIHKQKRYYRQIPCHISEKGEKLLDQLYKIKNDLADSKKINQNHVRSFLEIEGLILLTFEQE